MLLYYNHLNLHDFCIIGTDNFAIHLEFGELFKYK